MLFNVQCKANAMKFFAILFLLTLFVSCGKKFNPEITTEELKESVYFLASDSLQGRKAGEMGDKLAARFIHNEFKNAGLKLLYNGGYQFFGLVTSADLGKENALKVNGRPFEPTSDFLPYAFSANVLVEAPVVFAGYGLDIEQDSLKWNDYANTNVIDKWVLALKGDPEMENPNSGFVPFSNARAKALTASDKGAAGLILVAGPEFSEKDELASLVYDKNSSRYNIPVIQVSRSVANEILAGTDETVKSLEKKMTEQLRPVALSTESTVLGEVDVILSESESQNVVAMLPGTDKDLKNEYVVVGAHYDHIGKGGPGSGSRAIDTTGVHFGADDNASGVATVIELAEKIAADGRNKRSIIFAAFGAEEMGLIGSKAFVANPPGVMENIVAMFNFDMVGRLDSATKALSIGGTRTAVESEDILNRRNPGFNLAFSHEGVGPSDHASFYLQDIPVFFISTGAHSDYHTPRDKPDLINYEGIQEVALFAADLVEEIANSEKALTFQEAGPKYQRNRGGRFKVTLGIMPDYAGMEKRGMRVDAVTKGKPADKGGMKKGDVITAIEGKKVGNIYDYMNRLQNLEQGQNISVDVIRDDKEKVLIIQL